MDDVAHNVRESTAEFRQKYAELYDIQLRVEWIVREAHRMDAELTAQEDESLKRKRSDDGEGNEIENREQVRVNIGEEAEDQNSKRKRTDTNDEPDAVPEARAAPRRRKQAQVQDTQPPRRSSRISARKHRAQAQTIIETTAPSKPHDRPTTPLPTHHHSDDADAEQQEARVAELAMPGKRKRKVPHNV